MSDTVVARRCSESFIHRNCSCFAGQAGQQLWGSTA